MKSLTKTLFALVMLLIPVSAGVYQANYQLIDNPAYPTNDLGVATVNVLEHGIDNTGQRDCTSQLQSILDDVADRHG